MRICIDSLPYIPVQEFTSIFICGYLSIRATDFAYNTDTHIHTHMHTIQLPYIQIHTRIHTCMRVYASIRKHILVYTNTNLYTQIHARAYTLHTRIHKYFLVYANVYSYTQIHTRIHKYILYTYILAYTQMRHTMSHW